MQLATALDRGVPFIGNGFVPADGIIAEVREPKACGHEDDGPPPEDALWLARVQAGDEQAARDLVQRLYPTVLKSIRCHLPRQGSEEDLAQAVFAKIFAKLHQFSGRVPLEHWVSRITINTCLSQLNREKARPELRMSDLSEQDQALVDRLLSADDELPGHRSSEARELIERLMGALKPEERLVITLLHLEERSTEEIRRLTGWSISRIKVKAFRARAKMRKVWAKLLKERKDHDFAL